ncbi:MAG: hypothetical protein IT529_22905 [Burkholderiales bacterium]|nr:hypothetical protein [Burkholderiales bacterium]
MISRSRFFTASLWAAVAPVGMLVAGAVWLVLFPEVHKLGEMVYHAGSLALIGVPLAYTAIVVATYLIGRVLYELRVLSRIALIVVYSLLSIKSALFLTWFFAAGSIVDVARSFALFLALSLIAAGSAVFVWWRVASRATSEPGGDPAEYPVRVRRRARRSLFKRLLGRQDAAR